MNFMCQEEPCLDLQLLSEMGVPLQSSSGPNGGYSLIKEQHLPSISLTPEEATGLLLSYECLEQYQDGPFKQENLSTLTKIKASFSTEMLKKVERLKDKLAMDTPKRSYKNPYLSVILKACLEEYHLEIEYESRSGKSSRLIFPHGLFMSNGLWYCLAYCYTRQQNLELRVDRITNLNELPDKKKPPVEVIRIHHWLNNSATMDNSLCIKANLTRKGCKLLDPFPIGESIQIKPDGTGTLIKNIAESDTPYYGRLFLSLGDDIHIEEPLEVVYFLQEEAKKILNKYGETAH
jgi:predicted DNA-binding transcriptional regulator YafY